MRLIVALAFALLVVALPAFAEEPPAAVASPDPEKLKETPPAPRLTAANYLIPAGEILAFEAALNQFDRRFQASDDYDSSWSSFKYNVRHGWVFDDDAYTMNQFFHPYAGSIYYGFARSAGLSFYESFVYAFAGSLVWEYAGERTRPSVNDMITTTLAGTYLGEALYRIANLVLENEDGSPGVLRELAAAVISPPTGLNRNAFGHTFDTVYPSHSPAVFTRFSIGGLWTAQVTDQGVPSNFHHGAAIAEFSMVYGQPGKTGYTYTRPFDYFRLDVEISSLRQAMLQSLLLHGLILGAAYEVGSDYRGIWGLYGVYDYISPELFRASNTGFAFGTSSQWWISKNVALQTTALAGLGFGAGGTIAPRGERDYHYGVSPEAVLSFRLILDDKVRVDLLCRDYMITGVGSEDGHGAENVARVQLGTTVRIWGPHAVGLQYTVSRRDAFYTGPGDRHQVEGSVSLVYTLLFGASHFGAVEWRENP
ncbi:MAG: DUF3943 domain-containing protein [Planctomycetes bacterium]|nr:DUF3943 domain-containing protein [Planctomycetota bacterium]